MKIIDILTDASMLLGMVDECEKLKNITADNEIEILESNEKIKNLFHLIQYSIRELCTNYIPVITIKTVATDNYTYPIANLENFIRINKVKRNGEMVKFKIFNRVLTFEEDGEYEVEYSTYPSVLSLFEEVDFLSEFSPDVLVLGLCAYYCLSVGMFGDFEEFHDKYITKAESLKVLKNFDLPQRRWE